jgi:hypothetical protein
MKRIHRQTRPAGSHLNASRHGLRKPVVALAVSALVAMFMLSTRPFAMTHSASQHTGSAYNQHLVAAPAATHNPAASTNDNPSPSAPDWTTASYFQAAMPQAAYRIVRARHSSSFYVIC